MAPPIKRIPEDSLVHILQFIHDDYCSFANLLATCKELQKIGATNDRILMQTEMRKKYDARAPLFAAVHMGTYLEAPPMVYNGTCRHSSYLNDITVWKDVTRMILSNDFSIYESRQCLAPVHQCQCSPKAYEAVVDTIECGEKLCLCVVEAFAKIATSVGNTGQVKPANTASTVLGMLAHGNKNDILKLVLENKDLNVNFAPSASETALSYSLLCPHRVHMHYFVEYLDYNDVLYDSDSGYDSEMEIPSLDDSWENASLDTLKMLLGHPRINVNESSAIYIAASRNLFEHLKLLLAVPASDVNNCQDSRTPLDVVFTRDGVILKEAWELEDYIISRQKKRLEMKRALTDKGALFSNALWAVRHGSLADLKAALEAGGSVHEHTMMGCVVHGASLLTLLDLVPNVYATSDGQILPSGTCTPGSTSIGHDTEGKKIYAFLKECGIRHGVMVDITDLGPGGWYDNCYEDSHYINMGHAKICGDCLVERDAPLLIRDDEIISASDFRRYLPSPPLV